MFFEFEHRRLISEVKELHVLARLNASRDNLSQCDRFLIRLRLSEEEEEEEAFLPGPFVLFSASLRTFP